MKEHLLDIDTDFETDLEEDFLEDDFTTDGGNRRRLVYLPTEKIFPHPDNPRKDIGDITELSQSILESGVLQNLTVVQNINDTKSYDRLIDGSDDGIKYSVEYINHATFHAFDGSYTVIIGHRRLAAAKAAGIAEVPCVIADMDYPTQISTMMTENLQRVDLTIYEQAQCFKQMKLDLGMSIDNIAEKTGFSAATVRRRMKLCDLNQEILKDVSQRQISLEDFERLYKIEDPKLRDQALSEIGTANFSAKCEKALQDQEKAKTVAERKQICLSLGMTEISKTAANDNDRYTHVCYCYSEPFRENIIEKLGDHDPKTLSFNVDHYGNTSIRKKKDDTVIAAETEKKQAKTNESLKRDECVNALNEAFALAYRLRSQFIEKYSDMEAKKHILDILQMGVDANACGNSGVDMKKFCELAGYREQELKEMSGLPSADDIFNRTKYGVYKLLLSYIYTTTGDSKYQGTFVKATWGGTHGDYIKNDRLTAIYESLKRLGYEMSDDEKALMDGTHHLYYKQESK